MNDSDGPMIAKLFYEKLLEKETIDADSIHSRSCGLAHLDLHVSVIVVRSFIIGQTKKQREDINPFYVLPTAQAL
jgi:hypothetical protein